MFSNRRSSDAISALARSIRILVREQGYIMVTNFPGVGREEAYLYDLDELT